MPASAVKRPRAAWPACPPCSETHKPDWVLIELGANDGLRGFAPAITRANLTKMIELTRAHQAKTVLTQILLPRNYGARYLQQFEQIFRILRRPTTCR